MLPGTGVQSRLASRLGGMDRRCCFRQIEQFYETIKIPFGILTVSLGLAARLPNRRTACDFESSNKSRVELGRYERLRHGSQHGCLQTDEIVVEAWIYPTGCRMKSASGTKLAAPWRFTEVCFAASPARSPTRQAAQQIPRWIKIIELCS